MPTNRTRKSRKRIAGAAEISEATRYFRLLYLMPGASKWAAGKTRQEITAFWRQHRREILIEDDRQRQVMCKPFRRPGIFMDEIEREHPRRRIGTETWVGPCRPDGGDRTETDAVYETDRDYLYRLGLLSDWELEHYQKQGVDDGI